jgi:polyhydroxyalkanoate synthesis regulator phasin
LNFFGQIAQTLPMNDLEDLVDHLVKTTRLQRREALRVVEEVLAFFAETAEGFVVRRHAELQSEQLRNAAIYQRITEELAARRFAGPKLSTRQIRRIIYG